jgi:hypothetical protein
MPVSDVVTAVLRLTGATTEQFRRSRRRGGS